MKRYIHTEASASIPTYTGTSARTHTHTHSAGVRVHMRGRPPQHTKVSSKLSLRVIMQTVSGEWKEDREGGQMEQKGSEGEFRWGIGLWGGWGGVKKNLHPFLWVKLMTDVWCMCMCRFPRPPTSVHPAGINYTQTPFSIHQDKEVLALQSPLDDLYMCEPGWCGSPW